MPSEAPVSPFRGLFIFITIHDCLSPFIPSKSLTHFPFIIGFASFDLEGVFHMFVVVVDFCDSRDNL